MTAGMLEIRLDALVVPCWARWLARAERDSVRL